MIQPKGEFKSSFPLLNLTMVNLSDPMTLAYSELRTGHARRRGRCGPRGETTAVVPPTNNLVPLIFSTCANYFLFVRDSEKDMRKFGAGIEEYELDETSKVAVQAREARRLQKHFSIAMQRGFCLPHAPKCRTTTRHHGPLEGRRSVQ